MKGTFRQNMARFHTWSGLLLSWLLFAMFITGTTAYFQHEITRWMEPEVVSKSIAPTDALANAIQYLEKNANDAKSWSIKLPNKRDIKISVSWIDFDNNTETIILNDKGHSVKVRDTRGGNFLYRFHFDLHYLPITFARYLVGLAAMFMLVSIVSGIIIHKKIFKDFFTLRFGKGQRSWLDIHNMSAVFTLPFIIMITYTGLITLAYLYMPFSAVSNFSDKNAYSTVFFPQPMSVEPSGRSAPLIGIEPLLKQSQQRWGGDLASIIQVQYPYDENSLIKIYRPQQDRIQTRAAIHSYSGLTGQLLEDHDRKKATVITESVMVGLHAGRYASVSLRWFYFLSGLAGAVMVATGLILWTSKRRLKLENSNKSHIGFFIVERLNITAISGLLCGLAVYFLVNRLLPMELVSRANWEIHSLFITWLAVFLWAMVRPSCKAWSETLSLNALLFLLVPIVNALTTQRNLLASLLDADWVFVSFDTCMIIMAFFCFKASRILIKRK